MESAKVDLEESQKHKEQEDQIVFATDDLIDKNPGADESILVEEVSEVEEVKVSGVVDASAAVVVEQISSSIEETTSEMQSLEKTSLDELSSLIDFNASQSVAEETDEVDEENVTPQAVSVAAIAVDAAITVDVETNKDADVNSATADKNDDLAASLATDNDENVEQKDTEERPIRKDKEDKLNEATGDDMHIKDANLKLGQSTSIGDSDATATATASSPTEAAEEMDVDATAKSSGRRKTTSKEPARKSNGKQSKAKGKAAMIEESATETEDDDVDMPEYEVEKIVGHRTFKGKVVKYEVKWKGYSSSDNTIENALTMHDDVPELCAAYWATSKEKRPDNVPHVPTEEIQTIIQEQKKPQETDAKNESKAASPSAAAAATAAKTSASASASSSKVKTGSAATNEGQSHANANTPPSKRKRSRSSGTTESPSLKKYKKNMEHIPDYMVKLGYQFPVHWPNKKTKWNADIKKVCVQASPVNSEVIFTYLEWNNGEKTIHPMAEAHEMIPEKLIHYYEERLQFI
ncbi:hypothetical protein BD408DRAFT_397580 [Parasitella parasitica]|nr:hypothetical protein BD408DRAFT_397580 [Parasitella parasitica]